MVVDGGDVEPARHEAGHHARDLLIEQHEVTHDHRVISHLLEGGVGAEGERRLHGHALDGDGEVGPRHPDAEDIAGLQLTALAKRLLHRLPVRVGGAHQARHNDDCDEAEPQDGVPQPSRSHAGFSFHVAFACSRARGR